MRSVLLVLATACCLAAGLSSVASAADPPPGAAISDSLQYVARVPDSAAIVEGKFDRVGGRDVLVTTGRYGFRTYDVSDPAKPQLIGSFQPPEVLGALGYWQDEDMEIDVKRKLIIGALDPRHDDVDQGSCPGIGTLSAKTRNPKCRSGFYVISYADPEHLRQIGDFVELPVGHTTSCVDDCKFVWTGGPARRDDLAYLGPFTPGARGDGRPIWVTDLRDPKHPKTFPNPIDLGRNDGLTDYSHDVDVDARGFAGVSGRGGLLGYATHGTWRDPKTDAVREATPWDPVLVAGGGLPGGDDGVAQPQTDFIHNSTRPLNGKVHAAGVPDGNVALMTEEDFTTPCDQGLRIIDASDARNLRQVGYYYVTGTDAATNPSSLSWDTAWRGDLVYLFDMDRGIEILRLKGGPARSARLASVREPARRVDRLAAVPVRGSTSSGGALV